MHSSFSLCCVLKCNFKGNIVTPLCFLLQDDLNELFQCSRIWGMEFNAKKCNHVDLISSKAQRMLNLMILVQRNYFTLLGFGRALNMLA